MLLGDQVDGTVDDQHGGVAGAGWGGQVLADVDASRGGLVVLEGILERFVDRGLIVCEEFVPPLGGGLLVLEVGAAGLFPLSVGIVLSGVAGPALGVAPFGSIEDGQSVEGLLLPSGDEWGRVRSGGEGSKGRVAGVNSCRCKVSSERSRAITDRIASSRSAAAAWRCSSARLARVGPAPGGGAVRGGAVDPTVL